MSNMIAKIDERITENGLRSGNLPASAVNIESFAELLSRACLGHELCGCSQGARCLRISAPRYCYQPTPPPPPLSKSERLQEMMDIIDEAILLVSDREGEEETHHSVDSSQGTKAHSNSEQDEHPEGADARDPDAIASLDTRRASSAAAHSKSEEEEYPEGADAKNHDEIFSLETRRRSSNSA